MTVDTPARGIAAVPAAPVERLEGDARAPGLELLITSIAAAREAPTALNIHGADGVGAVFLDRGRVCWAAVPQTRRYLTNRLSEDGVEAGVLSECIATARLTRRPLGELLVERGALSPERFSQTLFEHSIASLMHVVSHRVNSVRPSARPPGDFSSRYAFDALPFVAELARRVFAPELHPAGPPATSEITTAITVIRRDELLFPIAVAGSRPLSLVAALELMTEGGEAMRHLGRGVACFRRGTTSWSIAGSTDAFTVSEGATPLSYSWMSTQTA